MVDLTVTATVVARIRLVITRMSLTTVVTVTQDLVKELRLEEDHVSDHLKVIILVLAKFETPLL
jgi:hypothetical protein